MSRNAQGFAEEGYQENVIAYRCVDLIAKAVASIPIKVVDKNGNHLENHELQKLLNRPNPSEGYDDWVYRLVAYRFLAGTSFTESIQDGGGQPRELWVWQPYQFSAEEPSVPRPLPGAWEWTDGRNKKRWEVDVITGQAIAVDTLGIGKSSLNVWKSFHPFSKYFGMSPIEPAAWSIDQNNAASKWNARLLQNHAAPAGTLEIDGKLGDDQYNRMLSDLENKSGADSAGMPLLLEGGAKWTQMGMTAKDMDWLEGKKDSARDTAAGFGVPTQLVPIQGDQTFANFEQAELQFWEDTVLPLVKNMLGNWQYWLVPQYPDGDNIKLIPDLEEIPALEPRRAEKWKKAQDADFITPNEKRELVGREPYEAAAEDTDPADRLWQNSGMLPIEEAGDGLGEEEEFEEEPDEKPDEKPDEDEE